MPYHTTHIAGMNFRKGARERLQSLDVGAQLYLERDPANKYDPNAVKVLLGNEHVGFVPATLAPEIGALMAEARIEYVSFIDGTEIEIHYREADHGETKTTAD